MNIQKARRRKILCIQLCFHPDYRDASALATTYNDGIYYIASFIAQQLPDTDIDMCQMFWGERPEDFRLREYDYILISALASTFGTNERVLAEVRRQTAGRAKIIFGGPHATFAPHETLEYGDFAIVGEGEVPVVALITALENGGSLSEVDNLCYRDESGDLVITKTQRYGSIANQIDPALLRSAKRPRIQWATISMSRGCPYRCSFCYAIRLLGREFRMKEVTNIRSELESISRELGSRRFYVSDINFATNKKFCYEVARSVRDLNMRFIAMTRIELADDVDLLAELQASGFEEFYLGVESEQPEVLTTWNKKANSSKQTERLRRLADLGFHIQAGLMFGLDSQDEGAIEGSARWAAEARILHPIFMCVAEYPFQRQLFGAHQDIEDHRIMMGGPTYQHYSYVGIFPRHIRPSTLQRKILACYDTFFDRAFELEKRPRRRARLMNHARCLAPGNAGMSKHIEMLEELERPYYTRDGTLKEDLLRSDFDSRYGALVERLAGARRSSLPVYPV